MEEDEEEGRDDKNCDESNDPPVLIHLPEGALIHSRVVDRVARPNRKSLATYIGKAVGDPYLAEAETPDDAHNQLPAQQAVLLHLLPPLHLPPEHQPALKGDSNEVVDGGGQGEDHKTLDSVADQDVAVQICNFSQDLEGEGDSNKDIGNGQGHHEKAISLKRFFSSRVLILYDLVTKDSFHLASQLGLAEDDGDEKEVAEDGDDRVDASQMDEHLLGAAVGGHHRPNLHLVLT